MTNKALSNLRVIDLTYDIAGPYCTKLMAGFGAEVIKIEHPHTGDTMRSIGPFFKNNEGIEHSIPFLWLNTGKKSITLNLKKEKGIEILTRLVQRADVIVENFPPQMMTSLGLNYKTFREIKPGLIMTSISNFGQTGPYKDYEAEEIEFYALSGGMYLTGDSEKPPLSSGPAICQYSAGLYAYTATLLALFQRGFDGKGQYVDISIQESGLELIEITLADYLQTGKDAKRGGHIFVPWDLYECQDGYATIISMPARHWHSAAEIFEDPSLFDKKYYHMRDRIQQRGDYEELLKSCLKSYKKKELFHAGQARGLAFGYIAPFDDVLESPQHQERDFFVEIDHPVVGKHIYCGAPFKMSRTSWQSIRAPLLGEHNQTIYGQLMGCSQIEIQQLREQEII